MKIRITLILLLLPLLICAQSKKTKRKVKAKKHAIEQYFTSYSLKPDLAATPYLYYQIYDWIGTNYKYAGCTKNGIDCSGFVNEIYTNVYCINLPGGSSDIWKQVNPIDKNDLQEGDIVFFKIRKGTISHVGIFLGNNKFAHASVKTGVVINDLDETYYKKYFYKGGRIP
ncbi:MAG: NlpC/P60 family protein [Bacteroidia bacterium]|nr:NlpC/P60 family protein [Bacteroidia bacterium]